MDFPFFISIPHSGEQVPEECGWLLGLKETVLMCDVDRYVDQLYAEALSQNKIPSVITPWHRYVVDLNRTSQDLDGLSVEGAHSSGRFSEGMGLHWAKTTKGEWLLPQPMSKPLSDHLVRSYHEPFHQQVKKRYQDFFTAGFKNVFQIDAHSMPSMGTKAHPDPGQKRADVVVSDCEGHSCEFEFKDLVIKAFKDVGFDVAYNWPYKGGRITETYGHPEKGQQALQVELNRSLYMDEETKKKKASFPQVQSQITQAITLIKENLKALI